MATKFFVDVDGNYIGGFDGAMPPAGSIEIPEPPEHGWMVRNMDTGEWYMPPEKAAILAQHKT